jgi:hypothetical protein
MVAARKNPLTKQRALNLLGLASGFELLKKHRLLAQKCLAKLNKSANGLSSYKTLIL